MNEEQARAGQALADVLIWAGMAPGISREEYQEALINLQPAIDTDFLGPTAMGVIVRMYERAVVNGEDTHKLAEKIADIFAKGADDDE